MLAAHPTVLAAHCNGVKPDLFPLIEAKAVARRSGGCHANYAWNILEGFPRDALNLKKRAEACQKSGFQMHASRSHTGPMAPANMPRGKTRRQVATASGSGGVVGSRVSIFRNPLTHEIVHGLSVFDGGVRGRLRQGHQGTG